MVSRCEYSFSTLVAFAAVAYFATPQGGSLDSEPRRLSSSSDASWNFSDPGFVSDLAREYVDMGTYPLLSPLDVKVFMAVKDGEDFLQDWFDHHIKLFDARNIYVFDDGTSSEECLDMLNDAIKKGVNVIWSDKTTAQVPIYHHRRGLHAANKDQGEEMIPVYRTVKTMSYWDPKEHMASRRGYSFDYLAEFLSSVVPDAFILPLDVDEFITAMAKQPGEQWTIQWDRDVVRDAFAEWDNRSDDTGYYSTHLYIPRLCNSSLYYSGSKSLPMARIAYVNPFDTHVYQMRMGLKENTKGESLEKYDSYVSYGLEREKKLARAIYYTNYAPGGHEIGTVAKSKFQWSRLVLLHYGSELTNTEEMILEKLKSRVIELGQAERMGVTKEQVMSGRVQHVDPGRCAGRSPRYCQKLIKMSRGQIQFTRCDNDMEKRGALLFEGRSSWEKKRVADTGIKCEWAIHLNKFSSGFAVDQSRGFELAEAKTKCLELGSKCAAITCEEGGECTLRASAELESSLVGETSYMRVCMAANATRHSYLRVEDVFPVSARPSGA